MISQPQAKPAAVRFGIPVTDLSMVLVILIWGVNFSVTKLTIGEIPPLSFAALRFASGALLLWIFLRVREAPVPMAPGSLWKLTWIGLIGNTLYQICFVYGLKFTTAANGALMLATVPALVALVGSLFGIEKPTRAVVMGIGMALSGVVLVVMFRGLNISLDNLRGDLLMMGCAIAWTIYTLGVRTLGGSLSPLRITTLTMVTGVPGLLLLSIPELLSVSWTDISLKAWAGLAYSSVFSLVLAYVLWNNSVRVAGSNRTAIYGCAIPLVAALVAWPVLSEQPVVQQGIGAVLIVAGVLLTRR